MATSNDNSNPSNPTDPRFVQTDIFRMTLLEPYVGFNQADAKRRWPWLREPVPQPCDCKHPELAPYALLVLQHVYDTHVVDRKDWQPQRLENWARTKAAEMGSPLPA
jgi:hypothetical protein